MGSEVGVDSRKRLGAAVGIAEMVGTGVGNVVGTGVDVGVSSSLSLLIALHK